MVSSMTGFGRGVASADGREITIELKCVNHRYLDIGYRMPRHISFIEEPLRKLISARLSRGHVDVFVNYRNTRTDARKVIIDSALLCEYLEAARAAAKDNGLSDDITLSSALRLPDVSDVIEAEEDRDAVISLANEACEIATDEVKAMRSAEGERLRSDVLARARLVCEITKKIEARSPTVVDEYRAKLDERIEALLNGVEVDRTRLATEAALFADKANITEEIIRLYSHVTQFCAVLDGDEAAGRRLDFIVQEMNREFNTIGSKANDAQIVNLVISGKGEIEKIREQIQNIE